MMVIPAALTLRMARSKRRPGRLVAHIVAYLALGSAGLHPVTAAVTTEDLRLSCALEVSGLLRAASNPSDCGGGNERLVRFSVANPVGVCIGPGGLVRLAPPGGCLAAADTARTVPSNAPAYFCASRPAGGLLQAVDDPAKCRAGDTAYVVVNHPPSGISLSNSSVAENQPAGTLVGTLGATDPDPDDSFVFSLVAGPGGPDSGGFRVDGGRLVTAGPFDYETQGSYSVIVRVTDHLGLSLDRPFAIAVTDVAENAAPTPSVGAVNDAPVAAADTYSTTEEGPLAVPVPGVLGNDTDAEGDPLTAALVAGPARGRVTLKGDGSFSYTPNFNFNGSDSFTYQASDGAALSSVVTVTLTVSPVNDAPTALDDAYTTAEDTPLVVAAPGVLGNDSDVDGDPLSATLAVGPTDGTLTLNADGSFTYTPTANFSGTDSFTYRAADGTGAFDTAIVMITVTAVDAADLKANKSVNGGQPFTSTITWRTAGSRRPPVWSSEPLSTRASSSSPPTHAVSSPPAPER
jgi:hypothetical protein